MARSWFGFTQGKWEHVAEDEPHKKTKMIVNGGLDEVDVISFSIKSPGAECFRSALSTDFFHPLGIPFACVGEDDSSSSRLALQMDRWQGHGLEALFNS